MGLTETKPETADDQVMSCIKSMSDVDLYDCVSLLFIDEEPNQSFA